MDLPWFLDNGMKSRFALPLSSISPFPFRSFVSRIFSYLCDVTLNSVPNGVELLRFSFCTYCHMRNFAQPCFSYITSPSLVVLLICVERWLVEFCSASFKLFCSFRETVADIRFTIFSADVISKVIVLVKLVFFILDPAVNFNSQSD